MVSVQINNVNPYFKTNFAGMKPQTAENSVLPENAQSGGGKVYPSFKSASAAISVRTMLTPEENEKYRDVYAVLDKKSRKLLKMALGSGLLLKNDAEDRSTVLDNMHKIITTPRVKGLSADKIAKNVLETLVNPSIITQRFGDIPQAVMPQIINYMTGDSTDTRERTLKEEEFNEMYSGCCVAASVEFNMAHRHPAEFSRFVEGLTSPSMEVKKTINLERLSKNTLDAVWLLNAFEVPYELKGINQAVLTLKPDKEAIIRARIQNNYRDPWERSSVDVMMQSMLMQLGTEQTYSSLLDKRGGKFSREDKGLIDFEKTFIESVAEDKDTTSVVYQVVDENQRVIGQEADYQTIKSQILEALDMGKNIIIGYIITDAAGVIENAHEITITGARKTSTGETIFICNDTDDDIPFPIEYSETYLIPKIHHAGLPTPIAEKSLDLTENWQIAMRDFERYEKEKSQREAA